MTEIAELTFAKPPATRTGAQLRGRTAYRPHLAYQGGLDGIRALAIIGVLLYHGAVSWAGGGFLGVECFFVLSGFLITSLLLVEVRHTGRIRLRSFWARRARRLLPALFAVVIVIGIYYSVAGSLHAIPGLKGDGLAALFYFNNWHQIANGSNYFLANGPVSPFQHTWSLSIEEQFYVAWPLLITAVFWLTGRPWKAGEREHSSSLAVLLGVSVAIAIASAIEITLLFHGGSGLDRVYYGTDTRATGMLTGASLAIGLALHRRRSAGMAGGDELEVAVEEPPGPGKTVGAGWGLVAASFIALAGVLAAMHLANGSSSWLFPFGLVGIDIGVGLLIATITLLPGSPVSRLLGVAPMRGIGKISYGLYLWHFPLFLWITQTSTGVGGAGLLFLRLACTFAVATFSYFVVEQPIRQRRVPKIVVRGLLPVAVAGAVAAVLVASSIDSTLPGGNLAPVSSGAVAQWKGSSGPCNVPLTNTPSYRTVPIPTAQVGKFETKSLLNGYVDWNGAGYPNSGSLTFHTCPPKRVFLVGDSIAFSLGIPIQSNEALYGVQLADAAQLGCAFNYGGKIYSLSAVWQPLPGQCAHAVRDWAAEASSFHADVIVVELGYRDEFNWQWEGRTTNLGDPAFDSYVQSQIQQFVQVMGEGGKRRILFLTVPYVNPRPLPDGTPAPSGSTARHAIINSLIASVVRNNRRNVGVLDIDKVISPGNRYNQTLNGNPCRFDGIHFTVYCASLLQPDVLGNARVLLSR